MSRSRSHDGHGGSGTTGPGRRVGRAGTVLGSVAGAGALAVASVGIALVAPSTVGRRGRTTRAPTRPLRPSPTRSTARPGSSRELPRRSSRASWATRPPTRRRPPVRSSASPGPPPPPSLAPSSPTSTENVCGSGMSHLQWTETIGSTDGHATGTYRLNTPTIAAADGGGTTPGTVHWGTGSMTLQRGLHGRRGRRRSRFRPPPGSSRPQRSRPWQRDHTRSPSACRPRRRAPVRK